ncbi:hypothetical protein BIY24_02270 [Halobacteriovorax marinus]|uniref:hypothetical protein n=1 Tax=Halobacteriovorax marinus TaxID=97084 RepID=UPI000BC31AAC|nr:hypothetical protein [Halobacteriovorax marinus]ATH06804.1 hypothetical protein BIY24_02270 [Halobacteriovorax marinus]
MKTSLILILLSFNTFAGKYVPVSEVPKNVNETIQGYFPESKVQTAELEKKFGANVYELKVKYKDILLEVEVNENGKLRDLELER